LSGGGDLSANRTLSLDVNGLTEETSLDSSNDYIPIYDASAAAHRKTPVSSFASNPTGAISGLLWSNNSTDATNDFDISAGSCWSADGTTFLELASAQTKRMDASWTSGNNGGALATGATAYSTGNTTYHVFLGLSGGNTEIVVDSSVTGANAIANHGFTKLRRRFSFLVTTASTLPTLHTSLTAGGGTRAVLDQTSLDYNDVGSTSGDTVTLNVPSGISVTALINVRVYSGNTREALVTETAQSNVVPDITNCTVNVIGGSTYETAQVMLNTDTSGSVRQRVSGAFISMYISTVSYTDEAAVV
jgi:hypothetical protein